MKYGEQQGNQITLRLRILPNARRCGIEGVWNESHLKIVLTAPPVDGKANEALVAFMAEALGVRKSAVTLTSGMTGRIKTVVILFPSATEAKQAVSKLEIAANR